MSYLLGGLELTWPFMATPVAMKDHNPHPADSRRERYVRQETKSAAGGLLSQYVLQLT